MAEQEVIKHTKKVWEELETLPLKYYGRTGSDQAYKKSIWLMENR